MMQANGRNPRVMDLWSRHFAGCKPLNAEIANSPRPHRLGLTWVLPTNTQPAQARCPMASEVGRCEDALQSPGIRGYRARVWPMPDRIRPHSRYRQSRARANGNPRGAHRPRYWCQWQSPAASLVSTRADFRPVSFLETGLKPLAPESLVTKLEFPHASWRLSQELSQGCFNDCPQGSPTLGGQALDLPKERVTDLDSCLHMGPLIAAPTFIVQDTRSTGEKSSNGSGAHGAVGVRAGVTLNSQHRGSISRGRSFWGTNQSCSACRGWRRSSLD